MLHILLLVLKFIGIIIAAILGILVLLACIVLFVPVRYEIQGKSDGSLESIKGKIRVTWLLHLFSADVYYKEKCLKWRIRIAFWKRTSGIRADVTEKNDKGGTRHEEKQEPDSENPKDVPKKPEDLEAAEEMEENERISEASKEVEEVLEETIEKESADAEKSEENEETSESEGSRFIKKIKSICEKIKYTFRNICDKIEVFREKKEKLIEFVEDETHRNAFARIKKELFRYFGKLKPKKLEAQIRYGFSDPYYTGKTLAYLSVLYPFFGEHAEIIPDFEQKFLKGRLYVKGRIRASHFVHFVWNLFWDKNIRKSYRHIKEFGA